MGEIGFQMNYPASTAPRIELFSAVPEYQRPTVKGKFIYIGDEKFYVRGVTYGTFRPDADGYLYPDPQTVDEDFASMVTHGINSVRTYTAPPKWLLDKAQEYGLLVMVGLWWEQFVMFLDDKKLTASIEKSVQEWIRYYAGHPAVLSYAIGNEIPSSIVRYYGPRRIEKFMERLYWVAKSEDPEGLFTYVNYPTTEYLQLPFVDIACFNVYLESKDRLAAYLSRLQNLVNDKPLIMGEIGLDSRRNGEAKQANVLDWQIRTSFEAGCAGTFVFAWTDEWHCGGYDIWDWDFGLTSRNREDKPALKSVRKVYSEVPFCSRTHWPKISVVVCTFNGSKTIRETLQSLTKLDYPNYEVIIINDGSNDKTEKIVKEFANEYGFKLVTTENHGLSHARNVGLESSSGEVIAYLDDDACAEPNWLNYLALSFFNTHHVGIGGPNIAPQGDGTTAECIAHAPGNPSHVMISDQEAEHIPGCNMAFRRDALLAVGGFDPQFKIAGDDVDICWRLKEKGWTLGYSPSAVVWHHRRGSLRSFWKQQLNYGKAEALLEKKWPEKYNVYGNCRWSGKLYGNGFVNTLGLSKSRIYHGIWGSAPFQSIYQSTPRLLQSLLLMPEWYLIIFALFALSCLGFLWKPLLFSLPILCIAVGIPIIQSFKNSLGVHFSHENRSRFEIARMHAITVTLHFIQPVARLFGRVSHGLTPWRRHNLNKLSLPWPRNHSIWSETWQPNEKRIESIEKGLVKQGVIVIRGGEYDSWDLQIRGGLFGSLRVLGAVEEHGGGKQMFRIKSWPLISVMGVILPVTFGILALLAALDQAWHVFIALGGIVAITGVRSIGDCASATGCYLEAIKQAFGQLTST
jgi:cellulose synthase/poly-beta-1,6-N-acetylglucosamine synthase-like glycosyltransferase